MKKIVINNLGPIKDVDLPLVKNILFIGPQASGKSTIAKSVYFFKHIRIDVIQYFLEKIDKNASGSPPLTEIGKIIRSKFLSFWGSSYAHHPNLRIRYDYSSSVFIELTLSKEDKFVTPSFSETLQKQINDIYVNIHTVINRDKRDIKNLPAAERLIRESEINKLKHQTIKVINELFEEDEELLFIPAGRSALAVLTDEIAAFSSRKIDVLTRSFAAEITENKNYFNKSLLQIINEERLTSLQPLSIKKADKAAKIIQSVLSGEYRIVDGEERIYFNDHRFVKLNYASSGQQESLWILLLIFLKILKNSKSFVVFEEPEAHLFPKAQKDIVELIALLMNSTKGNSIIITTHSPYVLTSFNNLIYAGTIGIGENQSASVQKLVNKDFWLDASQSAAYYVENGSLRSIIQEGQIDAQQIDSVSDELFEVSDKLVDIKIS